MADGTGNRVFFSYGPESRDFVEALALRLRGDARLSFWFAPWHSVPGAPAQEQMEDALWNAGSCAVFVGGQVAGWQNEQMRAAIQRRVEDDAAYRIIPVLVPGAARPRRQDLPAFLRRYEMVEFAGPEDRAAFQRLVAGILGIPPIEVEGFVSSQAGRERLSQPAGGFTHGHALVIGVADYRAVMSLPGIVRNDACDLAALLTDPARCGYPPGQVTQLLDVAATGAAIRTALTDLAGRAGEDDTAIAFFSGHGARTDCDDGSHVEYLVPYDCDPDDIAGTAISGQELTGLLRSIHAGRLLVVFDSCHSGGAAEPKGLAAGPVPGLSETYYETLAQGSGRVVIASSRPEEVSWALPDARNSVFTGCLLAALRGEARTLGDGYVRVFDVFRHVAASVPGLASQHPIFKAGMMDTDFPIAHV